VQLINGLLGHIAVRCGCGVLSQMELYGLYVDLSVTVVSPAKTAEPIEMLFGLWTWVGSRNHVLAGDPDPPCEKVILRGKGAADCKV